VILLRTEQLRIEGFRGVNNRVELTFNRKTPIVLLQGRNGLGKTSILQAIEWCLTGSLLYFSGGDFAREDAFVNLFHRGKKGFVEVVLADDSGARVVVRRMKKMGKSTGRGGSSVQLVLHGKTFTDDEAESRIFKTVFESVDEPATLFHLHQDSLRQILMADPKERSRAIDKILGTFEVRDFLEAMDIKRKLTLARNKLEAEKQSLERDRITVAGAARQKLTKQRNELEEQGWKDKLDLTSVGTELRSIVKQLNKVGQELGYEFKPEPFDLGKGIDIGYANEIVSKLRSETQKLDRSRIGSASTVREKRTTISAALEQYNSAEKAIEQLGAQKVEELEQQKGELAKELDSLTLQLSELERVRRLLEEPAKTARTVDAKLRQLLEQLGELKSRIGDEAAQTLAMEALKFDLERLQAEVNRFSKESQLVAIALEFVQATRPKACPVCMQDIDVETVIKKLQARSVDELSRQVEKAMAEFGKKSEDHRTLQSDIASFKRLSSGVSESSVTIQRVLLRVERIAHQKPESAEELANLVEKLDQKAVTLGKRRGEVDAKVQALNERARVLEQSRGMQGEAVGKLQKLTSTPARGKELLTAVAKELESLFALEKKLTDSREIDEITEALDSVANVIGYLAGMAELKNLEEEIPRITRVAKDLDKRLDKLGSLEASLSSISEILRIYLQESVNELLGSLETTINNYYSMLAGHPYFVKIKLEPDVKKPLIYNVRGVTEDETLSTYIPTRFSGAQMNLVGISLFLAHAEKMLNQLATIIMDDPTQSFDESHRRDLVKVIKELSESRQVVLATQDDEFSDAVQDSCGTKVAVWKFAEWSEEGPVIEAR
jgi:exonuclease SbcC